MRNFTHALRVLGLVFGLALAVSLAACGGGEVEKSSGGGGAAAGPESLANTWASGPDSLVLNADGSYSWTKTRSCKTPPCPQKTTTGRWEDRRGQLFLNPDNGEDQVMSYSLSPGKLTLSGGGESHSFVKK